MACVFVFVEFKLYKLWHQFIADSVNSPKRICVKVNHNFCKLFTAIKYKTNLSQVHTHTAQKYGYVQM